MKIALLSETSRGYGREFLNGIARFAQEQCDWSLHLLTPNGLKTTRPFAGFDGIIARVSDADTIHKLKTSGLPVVDASHQTPLPGFISVGSDDIAIARLAAMFFLARGFHSFAFCGYHGAAFSDTRSSAFRNVIADAGFEVMEYTKPEPMTDAFIFDEKLDQNIPGASLRRWVKSLPSSTAVFCANDMRAYQVVKIASETGIRVPQDISVLGTDNDTFLCHFSPIPLSSIDPNAHNVGYAAARLLLASIKNPPRNKKRPILRIHPGKLIERTSTEFHPISPEWLSDALTFIDRNRFHPLSVAKVVALCHHSAHTVTKTFLKHFGLTPGRYIMNLKMEEARRLIAHRKHSCKEIAVLLGFSSPQYFCNAYKAHYGHSPFAKITRSKKEHRQ